MGRINKEKEGLTVRFSVRIPREQYEWLRKKSENTKEQQGIYMSMNNIISQALDFFIERY